MKSLGTLLRFIAHSVVSGLEQYLTIAWPVS